MPDTTEILHVVTVVDQPNGDLRVVIHERLQLELHKRDPASVDERIVRRAATESKKVVLTFDPTTKMLRSAYWPVTEVVAHVTRSTQSPGLTVTLQMRPTQVHLSSDRPDFERLAQLLQNAQTAGKPACVAVNPANSEIEAVQAVDE